MSPDAPERSSCGHRWLSAEYLTSRQYLSSYTPERAHPEQTGNATHHACQVRMLGLRLIKHPEHTLAHLGGILPIHHVPSSLQEPNKTSPIHSGSTTPTCSGVSPATPWTQTDPHEQRSAQQTTRRPHLSRSEPT